MPLACSVAAPWPRVHSHLHASRGLRLASDRSRLRVSLRRVRSRPHFFCWAGIQPGPRCSTWIGPQNQMHRSSMDRKRKRKERGGDSAADDASPSSPAFDRHLFPILLAAARTTRQSSNSCAAARLLRRVLSRSPRVLSPLPDSLTALLPLLLSSSCSSVAAVSCEVLGAAALRSMEAAEVLASDRGIANGLARALRSRSQRVTEAACNSILDLSASSVGREHLAGSPVLPRILWKPFLDLSTVEIPSAQKYLQKEIKSCV